MALVHKLFPRLEDNPLISSKINRRPSYLQDFIEKGFPQRGLLMGWAVVGACLLMLSTQNVLAVTVGDAAPNCALTSIDGGQKIDLNQFKGKVVYLDFWASWCGPCAKSFPFLNELHQQFKDRGLQIVGVNLDENKADAKTFLSNYSAGFTIAADADSQCVQAFDVEGMPTSYIIDRKGAVHHVHQGFRSGEAAVLRDLVEKLL
jgi:peroxiredoxin